MGKKTRSEPIGSWCSRKEKKEKQEMQLHRQTIRPKEEGDKDGWHEGG